MRTPTFAARGALSPPTATGPDAFPFWTTTGVRALAALLGLANLIIVARVLGPNRRGSLAIAEAIIGLIAVVAGSWLGSLTSVRAARDRQQIPRLIAFNIRWAVLAGGSLALIVTLLYPAAQSLGLAAVDPRELRSAMFGVPAHVFNMTALGLTLGSGRIRAFGWVAMLQANAYLPALGVLAVFDAVDTWTLLLGASLLQYVLSAGIVLWYRRVPVSAGDRAGNDLPSPLRFGGKLAFSAIAAYVVMRGGVLLLDVFHDDAEIGIYAVAARIGDMLLFVPGTASGIILARLSISTDPAFRYRETLRLARLLTLFVAAGALFIATMGPWLIPMALGPDYASSYRPLVILLPGLVCLTAELVLAQNLAAAGVPRAVVWTWLAVTALSLALGVTLIPRLGGTGVALTATISYAALFAGIWRTHRQLAPRPA